MSSLFYIGPLIVFAVALIWVLKRFDARKEARRRQAIIASRMLQKSNPRLAQIMRCYAVGDYQGLVELFHDIGVEATAANPIEAARVEEELVGQAVIEPGRSLLLRRNS